MFQNQLKKEFFCRIPLRHFSDIGKINFPTKIDYRIKLFLETDMDKLFESRKILAANSAIPEADAEIILTRAPFVQYEQILLDKNFGQHLETIMVSKKILRMGAQKITDTKNVRNSKRLRFVKCRIFGSKQAVRLDRNIYRARQKRQTYDHIRQQRQGSSSAADQNTKTKQFH